MIIRGANRLIRDRTMLHRDPNPFFTGGIRICPEPILWIQIRSGFNERIRSSFGSGSGSILNWAQICDLEGFGERDQQFTTKRFWWKFHRHCGRRGFSTEEITYQQSNNRDIYIEIERVYEVRFERDSLLFFCSFDGLMQNTEEKLRTFVWRLRSMAYLEPSKIVSSSIQVLGGVSSSIQPQVLIAITKANEISQGWRFITWWDQKIYQRLRFWREVEEDDIDNEIRVLTGEVWRIQEQRKGEDRVHQQPQKILKQKCGKWRRG